MPKLRLIHIILANTLFTNLTWHHVETYIEKIS